jgi:sporulation protein YlmC with PRC-barrel domain
MPNLFPEDMSFEETSIENIDQPLEFKGSYLFDFEKGEFVKNPDGTIARCDDLQSYVQWCNKAMATPRYKLAYSNLYGHEFKELIGKNLSIEAIELEIKRMTIETLIVHPRTKDVINFDFQWSENKVEVYYTYEVKTIDNERIVLNNTVKVR